MGKTTAAVKKRQRSTPAKLTNDEDDDVGSGRGDDGDEGFALSPPARMGKTTAAVKKRQRSPPATLTNDEHDNVGSSSGDDDDEEFALLQPARPGKTTAAVKKCQRSPPTKLTNDDDVATTVGGARGVKLLCCFGDSKVRLDGRCLRGELIYNVV